MMRNRSNSDSSVVASRSNALFGARIWRGSDRSIESENGAAASGAARGGQSSQRGCFGPAARLGFSSSRGSGSSTVVDGIGAGLGSMPLAGVLGDITNKVRASRVLRSKVPKASCPQPPQPQPALGAAHLPVPLSAQRSPPLLVPAPASSTTSPALVMPSPDAVLFCSVFESDAQDLQRASEYAVDIFTRLLEKESLSRPKPDYMERQTDINIKMRALLIDWLVEVHFKYQLRPETLFLSVNIIDRYLSVRPVLKNRLQLLGVVALFIAAKYEEIHPPSAHELSHLTDHSFSKKEIITMECDVLMGLEYRVAVPTPVHFLDRLQRVNGCDAVQLALAQYALELSLLDMRSLQHPPSLLVSAALFMSNEFLGRRPVWPNAMFHYSCHSASALRACAADLRVLLETATAASLQAVQKKYQLDINHGVANLSPC